MNTDSKLMDMLTGYAAAHQHRFNIAVHMIGIPTIMLGVFIALSWVSTDIAGYTVNLAHIPVLVLFIFYFTLEKLFSVVFLLYGAPIAYFATLIGAEPLTTSGTVAAAAFLGGYAAQFVGHAVEKSMPVVLKHPVQANLAAPFFAVVELLKFAGLREDMFDEVQKRIAKMSPQQAV